MKEGFINPDLASFIFKDEAEKYHRIHENPQAQYLVSALARSYLNVSQIVREGNNYFSHKQKFKDKNKGNMKAKLMADEVILALVFCDGDHEHEKYLEDRDDDDLCFASKEKPEEELHNVLFDAKSGSYSFYDFGQAFQLHGITEINLTYTDVSTSLFLYSEKPYYKEMLEELITKTKSLLISNFQDMSLLNEIIKKGHIDLNDQQFVYYFSKKNALSLSSGEKADLLFKDLKRRLEIVKKEAEAELRYAK